MIALTGVHLEYETPAGIVSALNDVDLSVGPGEFVGVLGASGSGKTTLLNVIGGLIEATRGGVEVASCAVDALNEGQRARLRLESIGVVFQDDNLIAEFSAVENVMLPLRAGGRTPREAREEGLRLLSLVGLTGLEHRMPAELSGGQKQRVGIARGLTGSRRLLLADEPTGALDSVTSQSVFELLGDVARNGMTVVVATHDPLILHHVTRVVTMRDGEILADSTRSPRSC